MGPFGCGFYRKRYKLYRDRNCFRAFYFDPRYKPSFTQKRYFEAGYLAGKVKGDIIIIRKMQKIRRQIQMKIWEEIFEEFW